MPKRRRRHEVLPGGLMGRVLANWEARRLDRHFAGAPDRMHDRRWCAIGLAPVVACTLAVAALGLGVARHAKDAPAGMVMAVTAALALGALLLPIGSMKGWTLTAVLVGCVAATWSVWLASTEPAGLDLGLVIAGASLAVLAALALLALRLRLLRTLVRLALLPGQDAPVHGDVT